MANKTGWLVNFWWQKSNDPGQISPREKKTEFESKTEFETTFELCDISA